MITTASQLYSERILSLPKNKKLREALNKLSTEEHMIQLCNMEAMEQVHRSNSSFQPDYLVAYAMAVPTMLPSAIDASGAAFRSKSRWYNIEYKCSVTADVSKVVAFAFQPGLEIPEKE